MTEEAWKDIPEYEGLYQASSLGQVRSYWERGGSSSWHLSETPRRILKPFIDNGYRKVLLYKGEGRTSRQYVCIGVLVLTTFVEQRPEGCQMLHGPKGSLIDSLENLSWGTPLQNNGPDMKRDGTALIGSRHGRTILTEEDVLEIRRRVTAGEKQLSLAREFKISTSACWNIVNRNTWRHI